MHDWIFGPDFLIVKSYSGSFESLCRIGEHIRLNKGESVRLFEDENEYVLFVLRRKELKNE